MFYFQFFSLNNKQDKKITRQLNFYLIVGGNYNPITSF